MQVQEGDVGRQALRTRHLIEEIKLSEVNKPRVLLDVVPSVHLWCASTVSIL